MIFWVAISELNETQKVEGGQVSTHPEGTIPQYPCWKCQTLNDSDALNCTRCQRYIGGWTEARGLIEAGHAVTRASADAISQRTRPHAQVGEPS